MVGYGPISRDALVSALTACAETRVRARARRFLVGLSSDELEFIAGFVGACILESPEDLSRATERVERHHRRVPAVGHCASDRESKLILLREYLRRSGHPQSLRQQSAGA